MPPLLELVPETYASPSRTGTWKIWLSCYHWYLKPMPPLLELVPGIYGSPASIGTLSLCHPYYGRYPETLVSLTVLNWYLGPPRPILE